MKKRIIKKVMLVPGDLCCKHLRNKVMGYPVFTDGKKMHFCRGCLRDDPSLALKARLTKRIIFANSDPHLGYQIPGLGYYTYSGSHFNRPDVIFPLANEKNMATYFETWLYTTQHIEIDTTKDVIEFPTPYISPANLPDTNKLRAKLVRVVLPENHPFLCIDDMGNNQKDVYRLVLADKNNVFPDEPGFVSYDGYSTLSVEKIAEVENEYL